MRRSAAVLLVGVLSGAALAAQSYVPHRVFDTARGEFTDFEAMAADLAKADVVFLGEQHDDANTHRLELAVLEALARRKASVVLSLEMFERDVQEPLEHFLMGHMDEADFLKDARPWPDYGTDYKPLVDLAVAKGWPVVAANVPRPIAAEVAKSGPEILRSKSESDRKFFAADMQCPMTDEYYTRFLAAMGGGHSAPGAAASEAAKSLDRYYFSQCLKDETMGESIATAYKSAANASAHPVVVHVNGAFHSDYSEGTVARALRRLPGKRAVVVSMKPVANLDGLTPDADTRRVGQYVVYTIGK
jgi:uncharacterized iron-regulated protein